MKKRNKLCLALALSTLLTAVSPVLPVNAAVPDGWGQLKSLSVFSDGSITGWAGSNTDELEVVNSNFPVDSTVTCNGMPSVRVNVTKADAMWWTGLITLAGWCARDISQYVANGYVEFNVKGKEGGEIFNIGMQDQVYERATGETQESKVNIADYTTITTKWQHVKIPLKDLVSSNKSFDPKSIRTVTISKADNAAFTAWVNDIKITSPDMERSYPAIKVNQIGYLPNTEKYALVSGFESVLKAKEGDAFQLKDAGDGSVVYQGKLTLVKELDAIDSGEKVLKADFSAFKTPGTYYISVAGVEDSIKFRMDDKIYETLLPDAARYFFYQRQGIDLVAPYAADYPREDKTPQDADAVFQSGLQPNRDVSQGWYDAGDKGKYINNGALAISDMFWAYEMFPSVFTDGQLNIPETGNKIPDILDEAKWELDWILKMQDSASGGFYPRIRSKDEKDDVITGRIINDGTTGIKSTDDTACAAAILSHAYIMFKDIDKTFADKCLASAKSAWTFLEKNPSNIMSPPGPYNISDDSADRLWAAGALFRATGDEKYNTYFKDNYTKVGEKFTSAGSGHNWGNMWTTAFWCYLKSDKKDSTVADWTKTQYSKWLDRMVTSGTNSVWQNVIPEGNYFWGCNSDIMITWQDAYIGSKILGVQNDSIAKMMRSSINWVLGINPLSKSFISGYGENCLKTTFSFLYAIDGRPGIPRGYLAGGPNSDQGEMISNFAAKCFMDSNSDWVTNENCLNWNAPLIFTTAFMNWQEPAPVRLGDVNGDAKIDIIDALMLKKLVLKKINSVPVPQAADMNKDGSTNSVDYLLLLKYLKDHVQ